MTRKINKSISTAGTAAKTAYEAKVIAEASTRAGKNPQLHGHIHEILLRDRININPARIFKGETARLVQSPTAKAVDIVVQRGVKTVERLQVKDTASSIGKTIKQINRGQYNSVRIIGTKETAKAFASKTAQITGKKTIESSGISSNYTRSLATRAGVGANGLGKACTSAAKCGAGVGGALSGGVAAARGVYDLFQGNRDLEEVVCDVAKETTVGALSGAAAGVAATTAGAVIATMSLPGVVVIGAPVFVAIGAGMVVKGLLDSFFD